MWRLTKTIDKGAYIINVNKEERFITTSYGDEPYFYHILLLFPH
ncbi:hypothetical protein ACIGHG_14195 [Bacillus sp. NPDC077411]